MAWFTSKDKQSTKPPKGSDIRRLRLRYVGECQGVGFRWNSKECAEENHLTGWVKNLFDGSVELELQGTDDDISRFFTSLQRRYDFYGDVEFRIADSQELDPLSYETEFTVRF